MRVKWFRLLSLASFGAAALLPLAALARGGGGEHYSSGSGSHDGGGGGGDIGPLIELVFWLVFAHPKVGCPLLLIAGVAFFLYQKNLSPNATTQKAFQQAEADQRTAVSSRDVQGWVNALKLKDPDFELIPLLDKVKHLFVDLQGAWFQRDLAPIRPFLSDATFQRLKLQLDLLRAQGVRDAITDLQVLDLQIIGLDQSAWFDSVHVRVKAQLRDTDVPASHSDAQAIAAAKGAPIESFTEVWTFVRKPGAKTKIGADLYQGKCPNCGAPFNRGASNNCEFCGAVVNSGNFDWTLSEITQGSEHVRHYATVDGLLQAREVDPALNLEMLEDRTSLVFWKWIEAQSTGDPAKLAKLASPEGLGEVEADLAGLRESRRRRVFLECAVGGVITRELKVAQDGYDEAHVEVRWSAKMGTGPVGERPPPLPTVPQRSVFVLVRKSGAQTSTANGMSTNRCQSCNAPLSDSASAACDFCGAILSSGERDWVLRHAWSLEQWNARESQRYQAAVARKGQLQQMEIGVLDVQERERLLYMMAAIAAADGVVTEKERKLLKLCSDRWMVSWKNVELALAAGPQMFERLVSKGSPEAEAFLRSMVTMALVDGRIDRKERHLIEAAASHLGVSEKLPELLARQPRA